MQGVVSLINDEDALIVVQTERGEYTVMGLLGDYHIEVGDQVIGPLEALDEQVIVNETQDLSMQVYVEDIELSLEAALERIS
jgi:hypothetical protein